MICLNFLFVLLAMFICLMLCLDAMPSTFLAFVHLVYASFLCFGFWVRCRSRSSGLGLHPYTQVQQRVWISSFLHVCASFALFHTLSFRPMIVCLDLGLCHVLVCLPFVGLFVYTFSASLFVWLHPFPFCGLFRCNYVWEHIFVMFGFLTACLSLPLFTFAC